MREQTASEQALGEQITREQVIEEIVGREWEFFQNTKNEGGRAGCQDDWETFSIMRESQFQAWPDNLLESYLADLREDAAIGFNPVEQKYARMMETTDPEKYEAYQDQLPAVPERKRRLADAIAAIQAGWMESFAENYPHLAGRARPVHTSQDSEEEISSQTYLRGELLSYSEETVVLYGEFIKELALQGKNLNEMIIENTVRRYGYASLEEAEKKLSCL